MVRDGPETLSSVVATSDLRDVPRRGPGDRLAAHLERILPVVEQALSDAGSRPTPRAVTAGTRPNFDRGLLVGVSLAKAVMQNSRSFLGVDRQDHLLAGPRRQAVEWPAVGLVVSGGHTTSPDDRAARVERLGGTIDDAAGEAFDKAATMLELRTNGGPLDELAETHERATVSCRPLPAGLARLR